MCARILRRESDLLPFNSNFVIMDADDQENLVKRTLKDLNIDDKLYRPASMLMPPSRTAKNNLVLPDDYPARSYRDEIVSRVYKRYQELLETNNAVDFDDLLLWAVRLLEENPPVTRKICRALRARAGGRIPGHQHGPVRTAAAALSDFHGNLFVVGDEDQSIYRWRGADYRNVLRFEEDYPNCPENSA